MRTIAIILNATSGTAEDADARKQLQDAIRGDSSFTLLEAQRGKEIPKLARKAIEEGHTVIAAAGGDGTVSGVVSTICSRSADVALGVIAMGTLNHFAKDLGAPLDIAKSVVRLRTGACTLVDVAEVNGNFFINNSSIGMYPAMVRIREKAERHGMSRGLAFLRATITVLRRSRYLTVKLDVDGKPIVRKAPLVFVGNNIYEVDGLQIGKRQQLDQGLLCVYVPHSTSRLGLIWLAFRALLGKLKDADEFDTMTASDVTVETFGVKPDVSIDGEVRQLESPLVYRIHPKALQVIV